MVVAASLLVAASAEAQAPQAPELAELGRCMARQSPTAARALLATEAGSLEESRRARGLFATSADCRRDGDGLNPRVGDLRGVVAEALLEADAPARARLAARPPAPAVRANGDLDGRAFLSSYAACLADAEPAKSVALLATARHGQAERDAFAAYGATLADCMPEGATRRIDRFDVRNHLAARLYETAMGAGSNR